MIILLFILHVFIALALVGVVLLQKSEGGALGMGGGGMSGFMTGRSTANLLTRTTAGLAAAFFSDQRASVVLSNFGRQPQHSLIEDIPAGPAIPTTPAGPQAPAAPALPAAPAAPLAK